MDERLPVMPMWVNDFFGSGRVKEMDMVARGIYALLLFHEWTFKGRGLPTSLRQLNGLLATSSRSDKRQLTTHLMTVLAMFEEVDGRLHSPRCRAEWKKAQEKKLERSESGRKGGRKAQEGRRKISSSASKSDQAKLNPPSPSPSSRDDDDHLSSSSHRYAEQEAGTTTHERSTLELLVEELGMSPVNANRVVEEFGTDRQDVEKWIAYSSAKGKKLALWGAARYRNPEQMHADGRGEDEKKANPRVSSYRKDYGEIF